VSTQPIQIDTARAIMRGQAKDLRHNRKLDDAAIAEANRVTLELRQRIPWMWRMRGALRDWWAGRANR
jgi:hypothetical protein